MHFKLLKGTDLKVSRIGFGCTVLAESFIQNKTKEPEILLKTALEHGINFFDTASVYASGKSEMLLGKFLGSNRKECIIATKGGRRPSYSALIGSYLLPFKHFIRPFFKNIDIKTKRKLSPKRYDFDPLFIQNELNNSLKRINTDYIDIYMLHSPTLSALQSGKLFDQLRVWKKEGRVRYIGISVYTYEELYWVHENEEVDVIQLPFNPMYGETLDFNRIKNRNYGIVSRDIFSKGKLITGKGIDNQIFENIENMAKANKQTSKEYIFRYSIENSEFDTSIFSTTNTKHLLENIEMFKKSYIC